MGPRSRFLHDEILAEIFARLPFRSLLRLRCLSKSCRRLISDHRLPCGLLSNTVPASTHLQFAGIQPKSQPSLDDLPFSLPPPLPTIPYPRLFLHDCCNGFLLVDHYLSLYVGNPATSKWAPVPDCVRYSKRPTALATAMALAMFLNSDRYNVVLVPSPKTSSLDVFESDTGEWREVEDIVGLEDVYFEHCRLAFCPRENKIYVTDVHNDRTFEIDVERKVCLEIMERAALPVGSCLRFGQEAHWLGVSQGRLHQVVVLSNKMFVWVLDCTGNGAKSFVLKHRARLTPIHRRFGCGRGPKCVFVLGFHPDSDVVYLRVNGDVLISYDFSRGGGILEEIGKFVKRVDGNTFFYFAVYDSNHA